MVDVLINISLSDFTFIAKVKLQRPAVIGMKEREREGERRKLQMTPFHSKNRRLKFRNAIKVKVLVLRQSQQDVRASCITLFSVEWQEQHNLLKHCVSLVVTYERLSSQSLSHCGLVCHWDGGVGGPGPGRLDGLPLGGRDDEDAVGGEV